MGTCAGKNKSEKKLKSNKTISSPPLPPPSTEQPITGEPPSSSSQTAPVSNDSLPENPTTSLQRPSTTGEDSGIDLDILVIVDEQEEIRRRLTQSNATRLIPVTDVELESELAALVYGHPERDYQENSLSPNRFRSTEV